MYRAGHCKDDQLPAWWLVSGPLLSCHQEASSQPSIILGGWYTNIEPMNAAVIPTPPLSGVSTIVPVASLNLFGNAVSQGKTLWEQNLEKRGRVLPLYDPH
jgi:hypothetical protein